MANERMRDYWSTVGAQGWVEHKQIFDAELAPFADAVLAAVEPVPGDHLLDVGCGTGALLDLAAGAGVSGVGVDISPAMVEAAARAVPSARFVAADAQTARVEELGRFTGIVSRFGVMFFDDPVAAFANLRGAVEPGGRLAFVAWRGLAENPMFTLGTSVLLDRLPPPLPLPVDGAPGPLGLSDPDRIRQVLAAAGWEGIRVEPFDAPCIYGAGDSDGVEERLEMILGTSAGGAAREALQPALGDEGWAELLDDVRTELRRHLMDGRLRFNGATWLVTARNA